MILPRLLVLLLLADVPVDDVAIARRVAGALAAKDPTRADFLKMLTHKDPREDRDLGFSCRRVRVELYGKCTTTRITFLVFADRVGPIEVTCRAMSEGEWREWGKRIAAEYESHKPVADKIGLAFSSGHRAGPAAFGNARAAVLGPPLGVDPHPDLEKDYLSLWSPFTDLQYGLCYGEDGGPPGGRVAIEKILAHEQGKPLLLDLLVCPNPESRVYAAEALLRLAAKGLRLSDGERKAIEWIRKSEVEIHVTRGCLQSFEPAAEALGKMLEDAGVK